MNNRRKELMLASAKEYCKCVVEGKTLKYNNQCNVIQSNTTGSGTNTSVVNGVFIIQCNTGDRGAIRNINIVNGHKYLVTFKAKPNYNGKVRAILFNNTYESNFGNTIFNLTQDNYSNCSFVANATFSDSNSNISFYVNYEGTFSSSNNVSIISLMIIDLTILGLSIITSTNEFFATDLGKYIAKGNYLSYEQNGKFIHAQSPIKFKGRNLLSLNRTQGTLSGDSNETQRTFSENEYYVGISMDNYYYAGNISSFSKTYDSITIENNNSGYGVGFPIRVIGGKQYHAHFVSNNIVEYRFGFYDKNGNFINYVGFQDTFIAPQNAYWCNVVIAPSYLNTETTFSDIIFCEESEYQNKYEPNCDTNVLNGITLHTGCTYKTYSVEEITYNNLTRNSSFTSTNSWYGKNGSISVVGGELVYTCTTIGTYAYDNVVYQNYSTYSGNALVDGHKYLLLGQVKAKTNATLLVWLAGGGTENATNRNTKIGANVWAYAWVIKTAGNVSNVEGQFGIDMRNGQVGGTCSVKNAMLFDLTALGLESVNSLDDFQKTKLGLFLSKGYSLSFEPSNRTIKDQIVNTFKEIDLSTLTWQNISGVYFTVLPNDIKINGRAIAEKYSNDNFYIGEYPYDDTNLVVLANETPSGKALLELATPEINAWYHLEIVYYREWEQYSGSVYKLDRDLSDLNVFDITADLGVNQGGLFWLIGRGNNYDYCYEDGYIYLKTDDIENVWAFDLLINNLPNRMVSRRTINVESNNDIDLDFTKE